MIELAHVTKLYRTVVGVNDLDVKLQEGAYGLIGPNGSGKTTLINLLTGNLRPSLGTVRVEGLDPWRHRAVLRHVGLCPASDILLPTVSALEWVAYMLGLHGFTRQDAKTRAMRCLDRVGMAAHQHRPIGDYSLGMRQRTKLAQAIAHEPKWLILDEPFNGLDPIGRHELAMLVKEWSLGGRGLLLASHVLHEVESVTERFLLIHGGRLLADGDASQVQSMLVDYPKEIRLVGSQLKELATALLDSGLIHSLRLSVLHDELVLGVRDAKAFYRLLCEQVVERAAVVREITSLEGNLTIAFDTLLKAHRGELE